MKFAVNYVAVRCFAITLTGLLAGLVSACVPRIEVAPPKEPVTINMNVKVDHEIHIKVDQPLQTLLEQDSDLLKGNTPQPAAHSAAKPTGETTAKPAASLPANATGKGKAP